MKKNSRQFLRSVLKWDSAVCLNIASLRISVSCECGLNPLHWIWLHSVKFTSQNRLYLWSSEVKLKWLTLSSLLLSQLKSWLKPEPSIHLVIHLFPYMFNWSKNSSFSSANYSAFNQYDQTQTWVGVKKYVRPPREGMDWAKVDNVFESLNKSIVGQQSWWSLCSFKHLAVFSHAY